MIIGNASWGFRETPLEKQLEITNAMGLEVLELGIAGHENDFLQLDTGKEEIEEVKRLFNKYDIKFLCASTGCDFTVDSEEDCMQSLENVKKVIDTASTLAINYLRVFAGFSPADEVCGERWDRQVKCLNSVIEHASLKGVVPAIETHGGVEEVDGGIRHFLSTSSRPDLLFKLLDELNPCAGIVFDPANLGALGFNEDEIIDLYRKLGDKVSYMHLKDFRKVNDIAIEPCACGEGMLDWGKLMEEFSGFAGPGMIEYELTEDIVDGLERSYKLLSSFL